MNLIETHEKELAKIKKKYNFADEFNFVERIYHLPEYVKKLGRYKHKQEEIIQ